MKQVQFKNDLTEIVYAPMFEEHLLMELYWFHDYFMGFLHLTLQDILLECCDNEMISIYDLDHLIINHPEKKEYVYKLINYLKQKDIFNEVYLSHTMKDFFQIFTEVNFGYFKQFQTILNEELPEIFILYYCIHIYFWCLRTSTLIHYRKLENEGYNLYRQECLKFYQEIAQNVCSNIAITDVLTWIDFIDSFFVTNFGSKCSLLG
uniref:Uncharacterized protein n=1 Tax=viral metagenome TaxID=1070528 RepID=A0A6C0CT42_9ZZZZ